MTLWLIRGLPNSGKTTVAAEIVGSTGAAYAADDYFEQIAIENNWTYSEAFNLHRNEIGVAHKLCQANVARAMAAGTTPVVVHNTFTQRQELQPYLDLAAANGYRVHTLVVERNHDGDNEHQVPSEAIARMVGRWQHLDPRFTAW